MNEYCFFFGWYFVASMTFVANYILMYLLRLLLLYFRRRVVRLLFAACVLYFLLAGCGVQEHLNQKKSHNAYF